MQIFRLGPDDLIKIPRFAVFAVAFASQGETLLLTLFSFSGESGTTVSDWTHLSGHFRDWELPVKQQIINGGSRIPLCLKEMKICFVRLV